MAKTTDTQVLDSTARLIEILELPRSQRTPEILDERFTLLTGFNPPPIPGEPVLSHLADMARRRDPEACRLFLRPRVTVKLMARKQEGGNVDEPDAYVSINGCAMTIPRGQKLQVPDRVAVVLDQSGIW